MSKLGPEMAAELPKYMPNYPGTGNFQFFEVVGDELDEVSNVIDQMDDAVHIETADTIGQLKWHGRMYKVYPRDGESVDHYRARVLSESQLNTYQATADQLLDYLAAVLNVTVDNFLIDFLDGDNTAVEIRVPASVLKSRSLTAADLTTIIRRAGTAAGTIHVVEDGTLGYIKPADYGVTPYPNDGYAEHANLDVNGEPTDGSSYSGVTDK